MEVLIPDIYQIPAFASALPEVTEKRLQMNLNLMQTLLCRMSFFLSPFKAPLPVQTLYLIGYCNKNEKDKSSHFILKSLFIQRSITFVAENSLKA